MKFGLPSFLTVSLLLFLVQGLSFPGMTQSGMETVAADRDQALRQARLAAAERIATDHLHLYHRQDFGNSYFQSWLDFHSGLVVLPAARRFVDPPKWFVEAFNEVILNHVAEKGPPSYHRKDWWVAVNRPSVYYFMHLDELIPPEPGMYRHPENIDQAFEIDATGRQLTLFWNREERGALDLNRHDFFGILGNLLWGPAASELLFIRFFGKTENPGQLDQVLVWDCRFGTFLNHEYMERWQEDDGEGAADGDPGDEDDHAHHHH